MKKRIVAVTYNKRFGEIVFRFSHLYDSRLVDPPDSAQSYEICIFSKLNWQWRWQ